MCVSAVIVIDCQVGQLEETSASSFNKNNMVFYTVMNY